MTKVEIVRRVIGSPCLAFHPRLSTIFYPSFLIVVPSWITNPSQTATGCTCVSRQGNYLGSLLKRSNTHLNTINITRIQAQKAIGWSGRILGGTLMIGVVACADTELTGLSESLLDTTVFQGLNPNPIGHEFVLKESLSPPKSFPTPSKRPLVKHNESNGMNSNVSFILFL